MVDCSFPSFSRPGRRNKDTKVCSFPIFRNSSDIRLADTLGREDQVLLRTEQLRILSRLSYKYRRVTTGNLLQSFLEATAFAAYTSRDHIICFAHKRIHLSLLLSTRQPGFSESRSHGRTHVRAREIDPRRGQRI